MLNEKWTHAMACMALGAVAAYAGMWAVKADVSLLPLAFSILVALAGYALMSIVGRRMAPPAFSAPGAAHAGEARGSALLGHEIKNYLCTLKGNARLLRQRVPSGDQDIIDRIDRVVEKLESFTRGLSAAGDGATALGSLAHVRLSEAARCCARIHFHKRIAAFRFSEDAGMPSLLCDSGRLEQVLLNLYANALEAGANRIDIATRLKGGRLLFRIEDDGCGCAQEDLARIFEPFFTTKCGPARRGLGMFIVQSIVENHGGVIRVESKNGRAAGATGLIFTLDFPLAATGEVMRRPAPLIAASAPAEETWLLAPPALP